MTEPNNILSFQIPSSEIFVGLVGPVGTDTDTAVHLIQQALASVSYTSKHIVLSDLFERYLSVKGKGAPLFEKYMSRMNAGDNLRSALDMRGDAVVQAALVKLFQIRQEEEDRDEASKRPKANPKNASRGRETENTAKAPSKTLLKTILSLESDIPSPLSRTAFIFDQLKHPDEVETLRWIYGSSFFLVGAYTPKEIRKDLLMSRLQVSHSSLKSDEIEDLATKLMQRDEKSGKLGQNVQKTFPLADVFINMADKSTATDSLRTFFELVFGHNFHTPTRDEQGMFFARSAAVRSADLARQIGAAITTPDGELLATGCNDAAKASGGQYWIGDNPDNRDFTRKHDANDLAKRGMLGDLLLRLKRLKHIGNGNEKDNSDIDKLVKDAFTDPESLLQNAELMSVIEYFRSVHAEMAALMAAARRGTNVQDAVLYSTTFPCHECARHIVAAGIEKVIYIEPYPKSRVAQLYPDSIAVDTKAPNHISFLPFVGIAPRQYMNLFDLGKRKRKDDDGKVIEWDPSNPTPKIPQQSPIYMYKEMRFLHEFGPKLLNLEKKRKKSEAKKNGKETAKSRSHSKSSRKSSKTSSSVDVKGGTKKRRNLSTRKGKGGKQKKR